MDLTYTSVSKFYLDLKARLLSEGLTVSRGTSTYDVIFDAGNGNLVRLVKVTVSPTVVAVGWVFGSDADLLATLPVDAERTLPFEVKAGGGFVLTFFWYAPTKRMSFSVTGAPDEDGKRYRVEVDIVGKWTTVQHCDRLNPANEPNFKDTGAPYLSATGG